MSLSRVIALLVCVLGAPAMGSAQVTYNVYPIHQPTGWKDSYPAIPMVYALNQLGQAAGTGTNGDGVRQAFIGTTTGGIPIPLPDGWLEAFGQGINDKGEVAGYGYKGGVKLPFIGSAAASTAIPLPTGWTAAQAHGINNAGQVAGSGGGVTGEGFIGTMSGVTIVPVPTGWSSVSPITINNLGQVTGLGVTGDGGVQAFIGSTSGSAAISLPAGWSSSIGWGISDSGQVSGVNYDGNAAFIGTTTAATAIPKMPDWYMVHVPMFPMNNAGQVVGTFYGYLTGGSWIWDSVNGLRLLEGLVPPEWSVGEVASINDRGQILAYGSNSQTGYSGPVLLDPIDVTPPTIEPAISGTTGDNGWYTSGVTITWNVTDPESAITSSSGCDAIELTSDTAGVTLTCSATNTAGLTSSVSLTIKIDRTPPTILGMPAAGCSVWPPNRKLVGVGTISAIDKLSGLTPGSFAVSGASNEPPGAGGPDVVITPARAGGFYVQLRAERLGSADDRNYSLTATVSDLAGNSTAASATCTVPHDRRR